MSDEALFTDPVQGWEVVVRVNGTSILAIGSNHLSGITNVDDYADTVRRAAEHLLSFIGPEPSPLPPEGSGI